MNRRLLPLVAALMAAAPLVAAAQQPTPPMRMQNQSTMPCAMHDMMMGPMMGSGMGRMMDGKMTDSSMLDSLRMQLDLTPAQVDQMRAIHQRVCAAAQPHLQLAMQEHKAAMQALASDNLDTYRTHLEQAAKHMVEAEVEMAKGIIEFHKSLTPAQRQKMEQMHQRMMQGR